MYNRGFTDTPLHEQFRISATTKDGTSNDDSEKICIAYVAKQADGSYKVQKCKEFLDTARTSKFWASVQKVQA